MDREYFVSLYNDILKGDAGGSLGHTLIRQYIQEEGNEEQRESSDLFLNIVAITPPLYHYCLDYALDYYVSKFSVVKIVRQSSNWMAPGEQIVLVY